jgi:hypothetical protein
VDGKASGKLQFECVDSWGLTTSFLQHLSLEIELDFYSYLFAENNVYAGTSDGHICHFVVDKHTEGGKTKYESRMNAKQSVGLGKKPIEQLAVIASQRKLLVLCGNEAHIIRSLFV